MKIAAVHVVWLLLLAGLILGAAGCASTDPDNDSVRPWNTPQNTSGVMPIQDQQHPE